MTEQQGVRNSVKRKPKLKDWWGFLKCWHIYKLEGGKDDQKSWEEMRKTWHELEQDDVATNQ